ncbi:hypothetical protein PanWU01x14_271350 [Parasponia andersonii]|uniref:Uncharacterized protein n=1 Tax=Parasponia andersonii TaxID=3476 RepID=A0A2P5B4R3_PARAD|nr:hypothetical protein PanWU01x14_271350 [Parasponia andersonii]
MTRVAVKRLSETSGQENQEFKKEGKEKTLIYETYLSNKNLDSLILANAKTIIYGKYTFSYLVESSLLGDPKFCGRSEKKDICWIWENDLKSCWDCLGKSLSSPRLRIKNNS